MEGMKYGCARVSTDDQTPALQIAALQKAGCKSVFKDDGLSGATTKRSALLRCLKKLEHGDTLIVWKFDRSGRSLRDLITMLDGLKHRAVKFGRKPKFTPQQKTRARKPIGDGQRREDVAALLNVDRTTLYRALAI
jgi:DNA invertase Pin-like site-specific DNA recombinase